MSDVAQRVQRLIDELADSGGETGVQVAVHQDGELVIDAVAGVTNDTGGDPVTSDTLFFSLTVGKAVTSTLAHMLVDRGLADYDQRIVEFWPEFGAHGKQAATIGHALTQATGIPALPADTTPEDLCDWAKMCAVVADAKPWWEPGTKTGYHALTFGYLIGEIVRRVTGASLREVLHDYVTEPLGITDELFFGVPVPMKFGFGTRRFGPPSGAEPAEFGWSGVLGSHADANPRNGITFAVLKNRYARGDLSTVDQIAGLIADLG